MMMRFLKYYFFVSILFFSINLKAQQVSYTQWNNSLLNINPAFTGFYNGEMRLTGAYRTLSDKGIPDINTTHASFEMKPFNNMLANEYDEWAFGISANKNSSLKNVYTSTNVVLGTAYHKALDYDGKFDLAVGFQAKFRSDKIDLNSLSFSSQFDETGFNTMLPNNENAQNYNHSYFDFNTGVMFSVTTDQEFLFLAASAHQLNYAQRTLNGTPKVDPQLYFTFGYTKYINSAHLLNVAGNFGFNTPIRERNLMFGYGATITEMTKDVLVAGVYYRFNEILSPYLQFQKEGVKLTVSYDTYVTPKINSLSIRRGLELSAIFRFSTSDKERFKNVNLGCFK
jgi:type IX secretion system PorP/SprF family membrane protein